MALRQQQALELLAPLLEKAMRPLLEEQVGVPRGWAGRIHKEDGVAGMPLAQPESMVVGGVGCCVCLAALRTCHIKCVNSRLCAQWCARRMSLHKLTCAVTVLV